jgi:hypothetical protein
MAVTLERYVAGLSAGHMAGVGGEGGAVQRQALSS